MKKIKRVLFSVLAATLTVPMMLSFASCGGGSGKKRDDSKTQIQVYVYKRGFGDEWLTQLEKSFEEKYAEAEFETGKKGVQVWHSPETTELTASDIRTGRFDVYFMENADYYGIKNAGNALEDLSSIVTETSSVDGKRIFDKMSDEQKLFYGGSTDAGEAQFYALPHYKGGYGLIYNVELFDDMNYYFNTDGDIIGMPGITNNTKSNGPDGKTGGAYSADDGLPATYEQFYALCDYIVLTQNIPLCWPGGYYDQHLNHLFNALVAEYEGIDGMNLNVTFDSNGQNVDDLVVLEGNGIKKDGGEIVTESKAISASNGYDVMRQAGKYYALEFLYKIMKTSDYYASDSFTNGFSQTDNQQLFIQAGTELDPTSEAKSIAMLADGSWWQNESDDVFASMEKRDGKYSKENRKFAWMPLPKANEDKVENGENIMMNMLNALVCVKAGLGSNKDAVMEFVKYACSDEALVQFTQTTGALKDFNYTLDANQQSNLSYFTKSLLAYNEKAATYAFAGGNEFYLSHRSEFLPMNINRSNAAERPTIAFHDNKVSSAEAYFVSMNQYWQSRTFWN